ncbi:MAG: DNA-3-methyladenine glycosylase family protein [Paraclostridium sordellii]|uniref:DNA-(apurinic or apyrimidinic site) lyase n=1 Tax=Paraclostridium sordellii TaxID=1505 RepID=A0ABM9RSY0_PARSO|nr:MULTISPECIES: DNA glycosylase [Paeniclostridium]EPZ61559.1 hhH-GPD superbase excision DNA repair family protein [[Clostridium] sordellii VPI 9048] [Paeniclostridium sordellii VPI 9048]MBW4862623.1 8-oxoguanine DNA glycosylase [Paeniclostridium sp.]MBW4874548.1 8-oxoguanine DNA glycosylase [Paeniclostridium sp.]MBX9182528.1 8-oxoguanine DNA glycosylase [Paeniclostridium sordellii]MCH1967725.1 8-oxoguanine DNA glycosylase [Paeniclostridium sordellii]
MKIYEKDNKVILEGVSDFDPKHIFECGQCFRWKDQGDGSYTGVAKGRVINVSREGDTIYLKNTNLEDFNNIWKDYFDLDTDYSKIKNELRNMDEYLEKATEFGWGIRLLRQDPWEMIISFIISSNNRIPMIQKAIKNLSREYGTYIGSYEGEDYYDFPTPQQLSKASIEEIRACSTGFRDKYIKSTTEEVIKNNDDVYSYRNLSTEDCIKELLKFNGIGPKVGDCIALFGMQKYDTFPVDVWVKRVMQEFYVEDDMSLPKIRKYAIDKFGDLSGFAQQYLFYYARELGIGR